PRTKLEEVLADIWAQALFVDRVGIHDNYFELGGDSILSIRIVARANQAGIKLTVKQLFEYQTIAQLAAVVSSPQPVREEAIVLLALFPLTPYQHWLLPPRHHAAVDLGQSVIIDLNQPLNVALLADAWCYLLSYHDALRLRFVRDSEGWRQYYAIPTR